MRKYGASEKKVYVYPIKDKDGASLELMNVLTYKDGELDRVDTFIGHSSRDEYVSVGRTENLSAPGTLFSYARYVRTQEMLLPTYLNMYRSNLQGKIYTASGHAMYKAL